MKARDVGSTLTTVTTEPEITRIALAAAQAAYTAAGGPSAFDWLDCLETAPTDAWVLTQRAHQTGDAGDLFQFAVSRSGIHALPTGHNVPAVVRIGCVVFVATVCAFAGVSALASSEPA